MARQDLARQTVRCNEIVFLQHCAGALEQPRFVPAEVKLGAVSSKNNNQEHYGGGRSDIQRNSHGRQMKPKARKRFDARQRSAASPTPHASDFFRHLIFMRARSQNATGAWRTVPSNGARSALLRGQPEPYRFDRESVRVGAVPKHNALKAL